MNLKDNNPTSGMSEFQQLFVDAEKVYQSGEYKPIDPVPALSQVAATAVPRGYFAVRVANIETDGAVCVLTLTLSGELPVGKSGQYTSLQVKRSAYGLVYDSTVAAYFAAYPAADQWQVAVQCKQLEDFLGALHVGDELKVCRPMGDFGYNAMRDSVRVVGVATAGGLAPLVAIADGVARGKYKCDLQIGCIGAVPVSLQRRLDNAVQSGRVAVKYYNTVADWDGCQSGDSLFVALTQQDDELLAKARSFVSDPKYLRIAYLEQPVVKPQSEFCTVQVHTFAADHNIVGCVGERLVDVLERNKVHIETRCRNGECGWCRVRVVAGAVEMGPNAKPREADTIYGYIHACAATLLGDLEIVIDY